MSEFTGIWLPAEILSLSDLNPMEKFLLAAVLPMAFKEPCRAGNDYFAKRIGVSDQTVSNNLNSLHQKGFVRLYIDRDGGNTREIYLHIHKTTLYKYVGDPLSKFDIPLYKNLIDPLQKSYRPSIKSLDTLYKKFVFIYKDDSNIDNNTDNKVESIYKKIMRVREPFWSILKIKGGVYENEKTYKRFLNAEKKKKPQTPLRDPLSPNIPFADWYDLYSRKRDPKECETEWLRITDVQRTTAFEHTRRYVAVTPKEYRKDPIRYLKKQSWNDEIIERHANPATNGYSKSGLRNQSINNQQFGAAIDQLIERQYGHQHSGATADGSYAVVVDDPAGNYV